MQPDWDFEIFRQLHQLPIFTAPTEPHPWPTIVVSWREALSKSDALIICTPEYIYNVPAIIKNALEWVTASGELLNKPVLPITVMPHPPRGEKAMQSLLWSLQALDAKILTQLPLYQNEISYDDLGHLMDGDTKEILLAALALLKEG